MFAETESLSSRDWRKRIGGKWLISPHAYVITSFLGFTYVATSENLSKVALLEYEKWAFIYVVAIANVGLMELLFASTIFAKRGTNSISAGVAVAYHGFAGLLVAGQISFGMHLLNLKSEVTIYERLIVYTLLATWWGSMMTIFLDMREQHKVSRAELIERAVLREIGFLQQSTFSITMRSALESEIRRELEGTHEKIEDTSDHLSWTEKSDALLAAAAGSVRRVSQHLAKQGSIKYPKLRFWELPRNIIQNQPFATLFIIAIDLSAAAPGQLKLLGRDHGLLLIGLITVLIIAVTVPANALMKKAPQWRPQIFVICVVLLQSSVPIRTHFRDIWAPGESSATWQLTQIFSGVFVIFATSSVGAWRNLNDQISRNFKNTLDEGVITAIAESEETANLAREASRILHGSVQTRLVSCAMVIQQASKSGDQERINLALSEASSILQAPLSTPPYGESVEQEVRRKVQLWDGLCKFSVKISDNSLVFNESKSIVTGRVIEEGISNAIRHGKAKFIEISVIVASDNSSKIVIKNNGREVSNFTPGMGTAFLEQASHSNWSLTSTEGTTMLEIHLP